MNCAPDLTNVFADKVVAAITNGLENASLAPISRTYVGRGPTPSEDCCPDIVVWVSNLRIYDQASPDTLQENRVLAHVGLAFDVNVRLGLCFFEVGSDMKVIDSTEITELSKEINSYAHIVYTSAITGLMADEDVRRNADSITPTTAFDYQEGGCAGIQFAITVGVF